MHEAFDTHRSSIASGYVRLHSASAGRSELPGPADDGTARPGACAWSRAVRATPQEVEAATSGAEAHEARDQTNGCRVRVLVPAICAAEGLPSIDRDPAEHDQSGARA